jgi:hypothetical protein
MTKMQKHRIELLAEAYDCDLDCLLNALENNVVGESIYDHVRYQKTGKLPGEE